MNLRSLVLVGVMVSIISSSVHAGPGPAPPASSPAPRAPASSPSPSLPGDDTGPLPPIDPSSPPQAPLTLTEVIAQAANLHPSVLAALSNAQAAAAFAKGQGKWTNPRFQFGVGTIENNTNSNQVNQDIELFGQQYLRGSASKSDAQASENLLMVVRRVAVRDVASAYYDLWVAVQDHDLQQVYCEALRNLNRIATERADGKVTHESLRAKVELSRAEAELTQTEATRHTARARLNAARGLFDDPPVRLPHRDPTFELDAPLDPYPLALPALADLLKKSEERPEVQQQKNLVAAAQYRARLANRSALPWLGVQGNLSKWNYATATRGFQFTLNLPIFDWGRLKAERQQLGRACEAALHSLDATTLEVHLQVRTAWIAWQSAMRQQEELRRNCPSFRESVLVAEKQYQERKLSIDDTITTLRASRQALRDYLLAEGAFHTARIQVLWASGMILAPSGKRTPLPGEPLDPPRQ